MEIIEKGHIYKLHTLDKGAGDNEDECLRFVNREENKHAGTQTQEVIRALIDRTMHCDNCLPDEVNPKIIYHLRMALALHETRALLRKILKDSVAVEHYLVRKSDGHFDILYQPTQNDVEETDHYQYHIRRGE